MPCCLIGLGSNLGDRQANLESAIQQFHELPDIAVVAVSSWFGTAPIGGPEGQGEFLNGAAILETSLSPIELLRQLRGVESLLGRERRVRWDARTIDVDILLYDDICVEQDELTVPHPRMICRRFVLEPAAEIAGNWKHPITQWTVGQLLDNLNKRPERFAVCGLEFLGLAKIAAKIARETRSKIVRSAETYSGGVCSADNPNLSLESQIDDADVDLSRKLFLIETVNQAIATTPKLCIVPTALGTPSQQRVMRDLHFELIQLRLAPVLTITNADQDVVVAESVAAIEAMK